jgi:hypothetical protein
MGIPYPETVRALGVSVRSGSPDHLRGGILFQLPAKHVLEGREHPALSSINQRYRA